MLKSGVVVHLGGHHVVELHAFEFSNVAWDYIRSPMLVVHSSTNFYLSQKFKIRKCRYGVKNDGAKLGHGLYS